ncbi:MAG: hypothetical protein ACOYOA_11090 [Saprospiraceae bacterium]
MKVLLLLVFSCLLTPVFAQLEKTIHQTFEVKDTKNININIPAEYELFSWPGDVILVETNVKLEQANAAIMNFVVENGRYQMTFEDKKEGNFNLSYKNPSPQKLKTKFGPCDEFVKIRVFVPEFFDISDKTHVWRTKDN